ncbi:hypothetical protein BLA60_18105 [Actinophytocola xinjiangensis]|uniref:Uncharacterized protein n=1 Tax=Actinophytocola xinjiangensis TaxID=485602 RepID=A0A7Z0WLD0_9PSEU|nr:hypothetical protein [Actinophytocola xinjiangensis]OLF09703.1 hypothetical protein BLA60_18105 [Actinophytocola xinjiangensis]
MTVDEIALRVRQGELGTPPAELVATSVFWLHHGTRLAGGNTTYRNQYLLVRCGSSFGACAFEATGMTLGNGTFDEIVRRCRERDVPLVVYAQSGSAVAREFLGAGVTALSAEPFPFSQFSADPTVLHRYRAAKRA